MCCEKTGRKDPGEVKNLDFTMNPLQFRINETATNKHTGQTAAAAFVAMQFFQTLQRCRFTCELNHTVWRSMWRESVCMCVCSNSSQIRDRWRTTRRAVQIFMHDNSTLGEEQEETEKEIIESNKTKLCKRRQNEKEMAVWKGGDSPGRKMC